MSVVNNDRKAKIKLNFEFKDFNQCKVPTENWMGHALSCFSLFLIDAQHYPNQFNVKDVTLCLWNHSNSALLFTVVLANTSLYLHYTECIAKTIVSMN